jgi:hypothetical protein
MTRDWNDGSVDRSNTLESNTKWQNIIFVRRKQISLSFVDGFEIDGVFVVLMEEYFLVA